LRQFAQELINKIRQISTKLICNCQLLLSIAVIFLNTFARQVNIIFPQFVSVALGLPLSTVGYISTIKIFVALGMLVGLAALTPYMKSNIVRSSLWYDLWTVRFCLAFLTIGSIVIGLSSSLSVLVVGSHVQFRLMIKHLSNVSRHCDNVSWI
jgi:hypothetical protein